MNIKRKRRIFDERHRKFARLYWWDSPWLLKIATCLFTCRQSVLKETSFEVCSRLFKRKQITLETSVLKGINLRMTIKQIFCCCMFCLEGNKTFKILRNIKFKFCCQEVLWGFSLQTRYSLITWYEVIMQFLYLLPSKQTSIICWYYCNLNLPRSCSRR